MKTEKDSLISLSDQQLYPTKVRGTDFKVATPKAGMAEGQDMLVSMTETQMAPRHVEDDGMGKSGAGTPVSSPVAGVGKAFKPGTADEHSMDVSIPDWVDFKTGLHSCRMNKQPK